MAERDLAGYGGKPPHPHWPGDARVALQFVLNVEEGAESCVLNGDPQSEAYLHELPGRPARIGERDLSVEGLYEYGSRAGVWRILEEHIDAGLLSKSITRKDVDGVIDQGLVQEVWQEMSQTDEIKRNLERLAPVVEKYGY